MPWSLAIPLQPDESLSSWLVRAALRQGCDPLVLAGSVWPGQRIWTLDVDRGMSIDQILALSRACGINAAHFHQAGIRVAAERIAGRTLTHAEGWPWVLTLGTRNRRRHGGQQFCPGCLASDPHPYFRKQWRFAWRVACARHRTYLIDQCSACEAPVAPHRLVAEDRTMAYCSHCRADLRQTHASPASDDSLAFQLAADQVMEAGSGLFGTKTIPIADWFSTARFYCSLIRTVAHRQASKLATEIRTLGVHLNADHLPIIGLPLERLPIRDRVVLLSATHQLMTLGPEPLQAALMRSATTATSIKKSDIQVPIPLREIFDALPDSMRSARRPLQPMTPRPRSEKAVQGAWLRLQRKAKARLS